MSITIKQSQNKEAESWDQYVHSHPHATLYHFIFENSLISIPFFDMGGILADNEETEKALIAKTADSCHTDYRPGNTKTYRALRIIKFVFPYNPLCLRVFVRE